MTGAAPPAAGNTTIAPVFAVDDPPTHVPVIAWAATVAAMVYPATAPCCAVRLYTSEPVISVPAVGVLVVLVVVSTPDPPMKRASR
jgi:hypothetical protein